MQPLFRLHHRGLARCVLALVALVLGASAGPSTWAAAVPSARILKVLPHFMDLQGRHTINPSLFDRDAYQFELRTHPELRSGLRFDVLWKLPQRSTANLILKLELRGSKATAQNPVVVEARARSRGGFSQWTRVPIVGDDYQALGELLAWRATLWRDDVLLSEQTSFLW